MYANEYAAKRRMVAEAMGWRIEQDPQDWRLVIIYKPNGEVEGCHIDHELAVSRALPDFLADPAAFAGLLKWMIAECNDIEFDTCNVGGRYVRSIRGDFECEGDDEEAALFNAAVAWVKARREKEAARA